MKITAMENGEWFRVESNGHEYRISYAGCGDDMDEGVYLWECDCPGYRFRGDCKHLRAFLGTRLPEYDENIPPSEGGVPRAVEVD